MTLICMIGDCPIGRLYHMHQERSNCSDGARMGVTLSRMGSRSGSLGVPTICRLPYILPRNARATRGSAMPTSGSIGWAMGVLVAAMCRFLQASHGGLLHGRPPLSRRELRWQLVRTAPSRSAGRPRRGKLTQSPIRESLCRRSHRSSLYLVARCKETWTLGPKAVRIERSLLPKSIIQECLPR